MLMVSDYELLGIKVGASAEEIRHAFKRKLKEVHPDKNPGNKEWADEMTTQVVDAYNRLCPEKKNGNGLESMVVTQPGARGRVIRDDWNSRPHSDELYWRTYRHSAEAAADPSKRVMTSKFPFWDGRECADGRYWVGYSLMNGIEVQELPLAFDSEAFYMDIFPMLMDKAYFIDRLPRRFTEEGLDGLTFMTRKPTTKTGDLATLLITNRTMHNYLTKVADIRPLDHGELCRDMGRILTMGFKWYHSRWGVGFVPLNAGSVFHPKGNPVRFGDGVRCEGGCNGFYTIGLMGAYHNFDGFNLYDDQSPMMGRIMEDGHEVGIYLEQDAMPGMVKRDSGVWVPEKQGKEKFLLFTHAFFGNAI